MIPEINRLTLRDIGIGQDFIQKEYLDMQSL
jgi:hypothetical protein